MAVTMSPKSDFKATMRKLLLDAPHADMSITCDQTTFRAHRAIVCTQSDFFNAALNGNFKEAAENVVNLPDDDPETIERVLSFLYLQDYNEDGHILPLHLDAPVNPAGSKDDTTTDTTAPTAKLDPTHDDAVSETPSPSSPSPENGPEQCDSSGSGSGSQSNTPEAPAVETINAIPNIANNNIKVYFAADKFNIAPLKVLAAFRTKIWATSHWTDDTFSDVVYDILTTTPPHDTQLRDAIVEIVTKNILTLAQRKDFMHVMEAFGTLGAAVLTSLIASGKVLGPDEEGDSILELIANKVNNGTCRHCHKAFNIQMLDGEYQYGIVRCRECRTRTRYH